MDNNLIKIENLVDIDIQNSIESFITSTSFRWYYSPGTIVVQELDDESKKFVIVDGINPPQFIHTVVKDSKQNSEFFNLIQPIIENLADNLKTDIEIIRVKFNFLLQNVDSTYHYPHTDTDIIDSNIKTMIYYVNESDGDTYIFDKLSPLINNTVSIKETVSPKKGSAIIFDASTLHSGSSPVHYPTRIVLNVVFKILNQIKIFLPVILPACPICFKLTLSKYLIRCGGGQCNCLSSKNFFTMGRTLLP